jgi:crotonobetainyl-CoA:carnitine CoA-transferase CaiB-like acyl-CoA transferase
MLAVDLYRLYRTSDGWVFLAAPSEGDWQQFARAVAPELLEDSRFVSSTSRVVNEEELAGAIGDVLATKEGCHWEQLLTEAGVACVKVYEGGTFGDFSCTDAGIAEAGLVTEVPSTRFGLYPRHGAFVTLGDHGADLGGLSEVGEQSEAILLELGYSKERIEELATMGTVGFWP